MDSSYESLEVTINKKNKKVTKMKFYIEGYTGTYYDSSDIYTVAGGAVAYSNISYGDMAIEQPDELIGLEYIF